MEPLLNIQRLAFLPVCDPQRVDWVWFGWAHKRIQNLLTSQHVNNKLHRAKQMKGGHYALQSWRRITARKGYLFWGPLKHEVYMVMACLLGPLSSTQQVNSHSIHSMTVINFYNIISCSWPHAQLRLRNRRSVQLLQSLLDEKCNKSN